MRKTNSFEKVTFRQFCKDCISLGYIQDTIEEKEALREVYKNIQLPKRSTSGSAGYDFYIPFNVCFPSDPLNYHTIPTGIKANISPSWFLAIVPRSGLGFKYGARLANTVGIIDSDYAFADNEGHIMVKMSCEKGTSLNQGDRFCQGIFMTYGITENDNANGERSGGFGSTGK